MVTITAMRMTAAAATGEINLGSPDDLLNPHVPKVMHDFAARHAKVRINLHSAQTVFLKERLARGELDLILTTEPELQAGGEMLAERPLVWIGAPGGQSRVASSGGFGTGPVHATPGEVSTIGGISRAD